MGLKGNAGAPRLAARLLAVVYPLVSRLLFGSCRVRVSGQEHLEQFLAAGRPVISACWHYGVFFHIEQIRRQCLRYPAARWVLMLSASDDAELLAGVLRGLGTSLVRGSRNRGGTAALRQMIEQVKAGAGAGIIADGSQGPARKVQAGAILLAAKTGVPIIPTAWAADRFIALRSWDRTVIPKPFAQIDYRFGEPLAVPIGTSGAALEPYRLELERRLDCLYREAWQTFGRVDHYVSEKNEITG